MSKISQLKSDIKELEDGIKSTTTPEQFKASLREIINEKKAELAKLEAEGEKTPAKAEAKPAKAAPKPSEKKPAGKAKGVDSVLENCRKILAKHNKEKADAAKRVEKRRKAGKPATLTPSETVSKTAKAVKSKVVQMKEKTDKGLSAAEIDKLTTGIIATIRSTLSGITNTAEKHKFLKDIISEINSLDSGLSKVAMYGGRFEDGGTLGAGSFGRGGEIADIEMMKKKLTERAKRQGMYENFGQKEVAELTRRYGYTRAVREFDEWAMNFDYDNYERGGQASLFEDGGTTGAGSFADGGNVKRILTLPYEIVNEIKESVSMGYNKLVTGMISPKTKGVALVDEEYRVRGTYPLEYKEFIQNIIDGKFEDGGYIADMTAGTDADFRFDINSPMFRDGGSVNRGRAWTLDHYQHNNAESYEKPMSERKFGQGGISLDEYYEKKKYTYDEGGYVDENTDMLMAKVNELGHHVSEIQSVVKNNTQVEAWVLAKAERAATDLSDITHYLDYNKHKYASSEGMPAQDGMAGYRDGGTTETDEDKKLKEVIGKDYPKFVEMLGENIKDPKFRDAVIRLSKEKPVKYKEIAVECEGMRPTQNEISLDKSLAFPLTSEYYAKLYLEAKEPIRIKNATILTCDNGKYIIDGHHRWSQVFLLNPKAKMACTDFYELKNPIAGLKATQLGISADLGYLPTANVKDINMLTVSEADLKKYVKDKMTDEVRKVFEAHGISDPESHIWKNVQQLKTKNKPIENASKRDYMPQTDVAPEFADYTPKLEAKDVMMADGGSTDSSKDMEIAKTILSQLGGVNKLVAMTGAYNFVAIKNGVQFRIKNRSANLIQITLNYKDLYDIKISRIYGDKVTTVGEMDDVYFDQLKPFIEKTTKMYLNLFADGGTTGAGSFEDGGKMVADDNLWKAEKGEVFFDNKLIGRYEFDMDSDAFYVNDPFGLGDKAFNTKKELIDYFKKLYALLRQKYSTGGTTGAGSFGDGGEVTHVDLFEYYDQQPPKLRKITEKWEDKYAEGEDLSYEDSRKFLKQVEAVGYTFDFGLDNSPYGLRPIGVELNELEGYEEFADGGSVSERKKLWYVTDNSGNVKNISTSVEQAEVFLSKIGYNGQINYVKVPLSDWNSEKVSVSNIKQYAKDFWKEYADGGMMARGGEVTQKNWWKYAPKSVVEQTVEYYSNIKKLWNKKEITLSKKRIAELVSVEKIVNELYPQYNNKFHSRMESGGATFADNVSSISKSLRERKVVPKRLQKDYGKTYDKKESIEAAKRIAGAMRAKEMKKKK